MDGGDSLVGQTGGFCSGLVDRPYIPTTGLPCGGEDRQCLDPGIEWCVVAGVGPEPDHGSGSIWVVQQGRVITGDSAPAGLYVVPYLLTVNVHRISVGVRHSGNDHSPNSSQLLGLNKNGPALLKGLARFRSPCASQQLATLLVHRPWPTWLRVWRLGTWASAPCGCRWPARSRLLLRPSEGQ